MSATVSEIQALLNEMTGVGEDKDYIVKQFQALHDQLDQNREWFMLINQMVGVDTEEPAVNSVSDFVDKANLDREVMEHIRDENEVNKKNIFKFSTENMELRTCLGMSQNKIKKLKEREQEYRDWGDRNQAEIERLRDLIDGETSEEESDSDEE